MSNSPVRGASHVLSGTFCYCGTPKGAEKICDCFELEITVPPSFPQALPSVYETGGRIPRDGRHHRFWEDGSLCLGSHIRLRQRMFAKRTLVGFAESCLVPFLYAMSRRLRGEKGFYFGELAHGKRGILDDYRSIFGLTTDEQIMSAIQLLGLKRRIANKMPCPCGCGLRSGRCRFNLHLAPCRRLASRGWFRQHLAALQNMK